MRQSLNTEILRSHHITRIDVGPTCTDVLLAVIDSISHSLQFHTIQLKAILVCAGLQSKQINLEIQLSISQVRDPPTGVFSRFSWSRAWLLNTVFIKLIKHRIKSAKIDI